MMCELGALLFSKSFYHFLPLIIFILCFFCPAQIAVYLSMCVCVLFCQIILGAIIIPKVYMQNKSHYCILSLLIFPSCEQH